MLFYRYFAGRSRKALAKTLAAEDPFALPPAEIVERILELGNVPDVTVPLREMWPTVGRVYEVRREEQGFLVAIGRDAEEISVQELRLDRYDLIKKSRNERPPPEERPKLEREDAPKRRDVLIIADVVPVRL